MSYVVLLIMIVAQIWFAARISGVIDCQSRYNAAAAEDRKQFNSMLLILARSTNSQERAQAFFEYVQYTQDHPLGDPKEFCGKD